MSFEEAKKIKITAILGALNHSPCKVFPNGNISYLSPFRQEKTPSFFVHDEKNVFNDFGSGKGGNVIDFVSILYNITPKEAVKVILSFSFSPLNISPGLISPSKEPLPKKSNEMQVLKIEKLTNKSLITYANKRGICTELAKRYLKEIHYKVSEYHFHALAFENNDGGYEINSYSSISGKTFKMCYKNKEITTIKADNEGFDTINIFEGFFDFLSFQQMNSIIEPSVSSIVLNSAALASSIIHEISKYRTVNCYLDNDEAGSIATGTLKNQHPGVVNKAKELFPNNKDLNEWFVCQKGWLW